MSTAPAAVVETTLSPLQELIKKYPAMLVQEVKDILDKENEKRMEALTATIREENKETIDKAIEEMRGKLKPPSQEDIQKLLDDKLVDFTVSIRVKGSEEAKKFVIREVPQAIEKKMLRVLKDKLVPLATEISALTLNLLQGDAAKKIVDLMNTFEPALDVMADLCVLILDPYREEKDLVTSEWIAGHLTSQKILSIVMAQFEANRMRDFFSQLSQGMNTLT